MTALRFQTRGGGRHQTSPASLWRSSSINVRHNLFWFLFIGTHQCFAILLCFSCEVKMAVTLQGSRGSPSRGGDVTVHVWQKPTELVHSLLFPSCAYFCLYGLFNCISFRKFSRQLRFLTQFFRSYLSLTVSPDVILCGWLGLKHQLTN